MNMLSVLPWLALLLVGRSSAEVSTPWSTSTFDGKPAGFIGFKNEGYYEFFGIPFAQPPVPPRRFKAPDHNIAWDGLVDAGSSVYNATNQRDACVDANGNMTGHSEDCLYLDIYAPPIDTQNLKGVLLWIHGGSWQHGSKNEFNLRFWATEEWGVDYTVGVAVNYRMNIIGFPDFNGMEYSDKNLATRDNIAALHFVQDHISDFGGDSNKVTIFGESAGSMQVVQLWAHPDTKGLFHAAISQSPYIWSYENGQASPMLTRENKMAKMARCMDCAMNRSCNANGPCSFQTPTIEDMTACSCFGPWYGPMSDRGVTFPDDWYGKHVCKSEDNFDNKVPLLVGHNALEINFWTNKMKFKVKERQMKEWIGHFGDELDAPCVLQKIGQMYGNTGLMQNPAQRETMPHEELIGQVIPIPEYDSEIVYATSAIFFNMLSSTLMHSPNVFMYMFNESVTPFGGDECSAPFGAHACDVPMVLSQRNPFVMNETVFISPDGDAEQKIQNNMRTTWKKFASSGDPGWETAEFGIFSGGEILHSDKIFDPAITDMLYQVMCEPDQIPECNKHTCGDIKALYKKNKCCGKPQQPFDMHIPTE